MGLKRVGYRWTLCRTIKAFSPLLVYVLYRKNEHAFRLEPEWQNCEWALYDIMGNKKHKGRTQKHVTCQSLSEASFVRLCGQYLDSQLFFHATNYFCWLLLCVCLFFVCLITTCDSGTRCTHPLWQVDSEVSVSYKLLLFSVGLWRICFSNWCGCVHVSPERK